MDTVPTVKVKNGEQVAIVNVADLPEWQAKGWTEAKAPEAKAPKGKSFGGAQDK